MINRQKIQSTKETATRTSPDSIPSPQYLYMTTQKSETDWFRVDLATIICRPPFASICWQHVYHIRQRIRTAFVNKQLASAPFLFSISAAAASVVSQLASQPTKQTDSSPDSGTARELHCFSHYITCASICRYANATCVRLFTLALA